MVTEGQGQNVLVISHDDQYFGTADRILKLVDGKIIADEPVKSQAPPARSPKPPRGAVVSS